MPENVNYKVEDIMRDMLTLMVAYALCCGLCLDAAVVRLAFALAHAARDAGWAKKAI